MLRSNTEEYLRDYYSRKRQHSVVLQAVAGGKGHLWDVGIDYPGGLHDARVLRQSYFWDLLSYGTF